MPPLTRATPAVLAWTRSAGGTPVASAVDGFAGLGDGIKDRR
ncbi:hypothetical protein [Streptomyces shenzhenensis]|nr:hypothetical protein [Streptomyces shenzhenensis]